MGFQTTKIKINGKLVIELIKKLNILPKEAQKFIDRKRVYFEGKIITDKKAYIDGEIEVIVFKPNPTGCKPFFEVKEFGLFDKPSGLAIHPKNLSDIKTLLDDIKFYLGKNANLAHRIDKETSGLVIAAKTKQDEINLKKMFETKKIQKYYLALVKGEIKEKIVIDKPIITNKDMNIKVKVLIDEKGKKSITEITPIKKIGNNTLVLAKPLTGRQHQIRVHLFSIGHPIVGDPIYGVDEVIADKYLKGELSDEERLKHIGHHRLMLHAYRVVFEYKNIKYDIISKENFMEL